MLTHQRRGLLAAALAVLATLGVLVPAPSAGAAETHELAPGWVILDATVNCPDSPARRLNGKQAAAFIESWYFASIFGTIPEGKPPASLPKCRFLARDRINGNPFEFRAFYVSQGEKAWVGLPRQEIGPGAFVPKEKWYIAHKRVQDAFRGLVDPLPPGTTTSKPTTTTKPDSSADDDDSSSNTAAWIIGGVAGIALLGAGGIMVRSRRRAGSSPSPAQPTEPADE